MKNTPAIFNVRMFKNYALKPTEVKEVVVLSGITFFIHKSWEFNYWSINEYSSGTNVMCGYPTKKATIEALKARIDSVGADTFKEWIKYYCDTYGIANQPQEELL
jgi:hypothetical protein